MVVGVDVVGDVVEGEVIVFIGDVVFAGVVEEEVVVFMVVVVVVVVGDTDKVLIGVWVGDIPIGYNVTSYHTVIVLLA